MFLFKEKTAIGLEIDEPEIRIAIITFNRNNRALHTASILLPENTVEEGMIKDTEVIGILLKEFWKKNSLSNKKVVLGIFNQNIMVRFAEFPKLPKNKLEAILKNQSKDFIPVDINNVIFDFDIINEIQSENESKLELLIVAAIKEMIENYLAVLKIAKLNPIDIEPSILSLYRIIPQEHLANTIALIDLGNSKSNILINSEGTPKLARVLPTCVNKLVETAGINFDELITSAELYDEIINQWMLELANEIYSSVSYYQSQGALTPPKILYLCGKGAKITGITYKLQDLLNVSVKLFNPLERLKINNTEVHNSIDYSICIALACRELEGLK